VRANFKETQLGKIHVGMKAEIRVDAFPDLRLKGHVKSISPTSGAKLSMIPTENATGNYTKIVQKVPVVIQIDTKLKVPLTAGLSAHPTLIVTPEIERQHASEE
jgi:membrane fusion protein (multidrug efflux system)